MKLFSEACVFGEDLILSRDLDPVYEVVWGAELSAADRLRWILAYSMFYHMGTATWLATAPNFWEAAREAAGSREFPRGTERRHFRAAAAVSTVDWFRTHWPRIPEDLLRLWLGEPRAFYWFTGPKGISPLIQRAPQYGPWIAFKVADLLERVLEVDIRFDAANLDMYREPRAGAGLVITGEPGEVSGRTAEVVERLREALSGLKAPPRFERSVSFQEVETVLCKFKSSFGGHYPPGKDTREVREALHWTRAGASQEFEDRMELFRTTFREIYGAGKR